MNIRDLWLQAGGGYDMGNQHEWPKWVINDPTTFADLIVKECCQAIERQYKYSNGTPVSFWEMSQDVQDLLNKHFGIEDEQV